jgi:hypothetical protein
LSVGVGLGVLAELLEDEVVAVVGAKGKHDPDRVAVRHGHESGEVTLGGRRVAVERPRVRSADGCAELRLQTYEHFADRDLLSRVVLERMLAGVSTCRYRRTGEPVGSELEAYHGENKQEDFLVLHGECIIESIPAGGSDVPLDGEARAFGSNPLRFESATGSVSGPREPWR